MASTKVSALIVAGGVGERMGGRVPKQYWNLGGQAVIARTIRAFAASGHIDDVWVVIHPGHRQLYEDTCANLNVAGVVEGGATRQASVHAGLLAMEGSKPDYVLIHDAVRPFVSDALIERVISLLAKDVCVVPVIRVADTLKEISGDEVRRTVPRDDLAAVQTPQGFCYAQIRKAHELHRDESYTDDAALMEMLGGKVLWVDGDLRNMKLTTSHDWVQARLQVDMSMETCVGSGYDVHRLVPFDPELPAGERSIKLGGVEIGHHLRLEGHSDADVLLHAVVDALLGAMGKGDIGQHFPPSDARYKDMDSAFFVREARALLERLGGRIVHLDATLICESPRIGPHREAIVTKISHLLEIEPARVNLKATTTEKLGFTGRSEGIAAEAVATILLPKL